MEKAVRAIDSATDPERAILWRDLAIVALVTLFIGLLCAHFEVSELFFASTRRWEHLQLDELPAMLLALALSLAWFSWRRYVDMRAQLARRQSAEAGLARLLLDNRRLAHQCIQVQESERKLLARELHDELGQYLNAIKTDAVRIQSGAGGAAQPIAGASAAIIRHVDHVHAVVHGLIRRLRPIGLDELGLRAALEHYLGECRQRLPDTRLDVNFEGDLDSLGEPISLAVYRLTQEGMTNVAKHAHARRVQLRVTRKATGGAQAGEVLFSMVNDGCDPRPNGHSGGVGLIGMRERIETLGGQLHIRGESPGSFGIRASIPVVRTEPDALR